MENRSAFQMRASARGEPERGASGSNAVRPAMRPKARILAVDDSPDALTILRLFLSVEGFEVITADGVTEALLRVQEQLPDLIITDYAMPGRTGARSVPTSSIASDNAPHSNCSAYRHRSAADEDSAL